MSPISMTEASNEYADRPNNAPEEMRTRYCGFTGFDRLVDSGIETSGLDATGRGTRETGGLIRGTAHCVRPSNYAHVDTGKAVSLKSRCLRTARVGPYV